MDNNELDRLERDLCAISGRLAASRDWETVSVGMRRQLRRPYWDLGWLVGAIALLGLWGLQEPRAAVAAAVLLVLVIPGRLRAAWDRRERLSRNDRELFTDCAEEIQRRFAGQLMVLLFGLPAAISLAVVAFAVHDPTWPLALAALITLYLPVHFRFRMRGTARELSESARWRRPAEGSTSSTGEDVGDEDDDDDESWLNLTLGIALELFWVFALYLGPPLTLVMLVLAWRYDDPTRPLVAAGALVVLWVLVWNLVAKRNGESDE